MALCKLSGCFLFLLAIASGATVGDTDRYIPLVQDGGGWSTQLVITNLSDKPTVVVASFLTAKGYAEEWKIELKASQGKISRASVEAILDPGASVIIETSGSPDTLTRGYADVVEYLGQPISAYARLIKRQVKDDKTVVVQSFCVPRSPAFESRSVLPVDLTDPSATMELVFVSPTTSTALDIRFRKDTGELAFSDTITFNGNGQIFVPLLDQWPKLAGFRGTLEWKVSFPMADRYEERIMAALALWSANGLAPLPLSGMTLKADQLTTNPYN